MEENKEKNTPVKENEMVSIALCNDEKGEVCISNNVVAAIIRKYVLGIDGVIRTAPQGLAEGLANIFSRRAYESSIGLELPEEGAVITLALVLRFGCNVPEVANEIKTILFDKIPALTGYPVAKVNVNVVDLEDESEINDDLLPAHQE